MLQGLKRVAVGVSGGADSMALLWLMAQGNRPAWAPFVVAAHVNHGLRGKASDADERRVKRFAAELGVPFKIFRLESDVIIRDSEGSVEESARRYRYRALKNIVHRCRCEAIVLAHHQDDLVETFLMRLLRGSGLTGLGTFGPVSDIDGLRVIRPLIDWERKELREVVRFAHLDYGEDETNRDIRYMRNRIRRRIVPYLDRMTDHPPLGRILARTVRILNRESKALDALVRERYKRERKERFNPRRIGISSKALEENGGVFAEHLIRLIVMDALGSAYPPSEARTRELVTFALSRRTGSLLQTERNVVAWCSDDGIMWLYVKARRQMGREELITLFDRS